MPRAPKFIAPIFFALGFAAAAMLWQQHGGANESEVRAAHGEHSNAAPGFDIMRAEVADLDGNKTVLGDLVKEHGGATVLINFWATWCAPCVHEMPLINEAAKQMPNVFVAGITTDNAATIKKFLAKHKDTLNINYPLLSAKFSIHKYWQAQGNKIGALPFTIVLDANGKITNKKIGEFTEGAQSIIDFTRQ